MPEPVENLWIKCAARTRRTLGAQRSRTVRRPSAAHSGAPSPNRRLTCLPLGQTGAPPILGAPRRTRAPRCLPQVRRSPLSLRSGAPAHPAQSQNERKESKP